MMSQCHLVKAQLLSTAIGRCTAKISTGKAGTAAFFSVGGHYIHIIAVMLQSIMSAKIHQLLLRKIGRKHGVDCVAG